MTRTPEESAAYMRAYRAKRKSLTKPDMKSLSSRDFGRSYPSLTEAVQVTKYGGVIGTWIPLGADRQSVEVTQPEQQPASESVLAAAIRLLLRAAENK